MKIEYFDILDSTQLYLKQYINSSNYINPLCIVANQQTNGQGSRNNIWISDQGNLFFSFVIEKRLLPDDLPIQSMSIYFSYLLKDILSKIGSKVKLKWPNDFFIGDKKIGGTITNINNKLVYCGIGLNLHKIDNKYGYLDIDVSKNIILEKYFVALEKYPSWKQIISKYEIEFHCNNNFKINIENKNVLLKDTILQYDGSLLVNGKKVFSLR